MIYVPKLLQWLMSVGLFASSWVILCLYESYLYLLLALGTCVNVMGELISSLRMCLSSRQPRLNHYWVALI